MERSDYRKELRHLYNPSAKEVSVVEVPEMDFVMVDGQGDPNTSKEFRAAVEALFALSYTIKFMIKKGPSQIDYAVFPLEGLWWAEDMSAFILGSRDQWKWTAMIAQPRYVTRSLFEAAVHEVERKKGLALLGKVRLETLREGKAAQIMHVGPFAGEGPTIAKMHAFIHDMGCEPSGRHHEIYLSDVRKTTPEKLKTVLRQPFRERGSQRTEP